MQLNAVLHGSYLLKAATACFHWAHVDTRASDTLSNEAALLHERHLFKEAVGPSVLQQNHIYFIHLNNVACSPSVGNYLVLLLVDWVLWDSIWFYGHPYAILLSVERPLVEWFLLLHPFRVLAPLDAPKIFISSPPPTLYIIAQLCSPPKLKGKK